MELRNQLSFETEKGAALHRGGNFQFTPFFFLFQFKNKNIIKYHQAFYAICTCPDQEMPASWYTHVVFNWKAI
jgi:hypothetical protein